VEANTEILYLNAADLIPSLQHVNRQSDVKGANNFAKFTFTAWQNL